MRDFILSSIGSYKTIIEHYDFVYSGGKMVLTTQGYPMITHWTEYAYSQEQRQGFKNEILKYRLEIARLKKIIKKIDELAPNDNSFYSSIASLEGSISSISSKIGSINPSFFADYM